MLKQIVRVAEILKPLLVKIIPITILRKMKKRMLSIYESRMTKIKLRPYDISYCQKGINLIGNIKGDSGLGQSCRLLAAELETLDYPLCIVQHTSSLNLSMNDMTYDGKLSQSIKYGINIFHINAHEFFISYCQLGKKTFERHYNIAYWLWELEEFPDEWAKYTNMLDEIWTPAEFISESIRKQTNKPVITVPYYITAPVCSEYDREYFDLPQNKFLFLMMFDCGSMIERKNPQAAISAFKMAFTPEDVNVGLLIKVNGGDDNSIKLIRSYFEEYDNIFLINKTLTKLEINSLIRCVDVVVSLHRAEGFGLVLAEAMINGVPCIATNWSANTEFMNEDVACMVEYDLVALNNDVGPYKKGQRWANPSVTQASLYMKKLYKDQEYYNDIRERAEQHVRERLSLERVKSIINERIKIIDLEREKCNL